jgi:hypothetical protein
MKSPAPDTLDPTSFEELEEYETDTPLEARFDFKTIEILVTEGISKHKAYDMMFEEYLTERGKIIHWDMTEKKRIIFYLPLFPSMLSSDYATHFRISHYNFIVFLIELGLITFNYDYHDEYDTAKQGRFNLSQKLTDNIKRRHYLNMDRQKISTGSSSNVRDGKCKRFTPTIPEWLYNALTDCANSFNMSLTDLVYLCWCIGASKTLPSDLVNPMIDEDIHKVLNDFNIDLQIYLEHIESTLSKIST